MVKPLTLLIKLQTAEHLEEKLNTLQRSHPGRRQLLELRETIFQKQAGCDAMMKRLDAVERDLDRAGHHVDELTSAAKQLEERIYSGKVKNLKELDKLQEKRENHKAKIVEIEEKALTLLEEQENLAEGISREKHEISKMKSRFNQERLKIKEEIDKITKELEDAAKEKHQVLVNLPLEILDKYNRVKIKRAEPVAIVENGQCTGCRMGVSIMLAQEVQITQKVIYCENCGRILVPNEEEI